MQEILDEYTEAILGTIGAILIIGISYFLFMEGGELAQIISDAANNSI